ncbi:unnamed protein product [Haemonchus placei]|uniref:tRNA pseudouridine(38-40) synthase n=1 Tax=Haemonchus placei TaxID=6290 RepID=A0A0N4X3C7_HAEPC|nr:unnamed protein product [Haemonchus placei]
MRIYKYSLPRANLDIEAMRRAGALLVGTHDFRNFCQLIFQVDMNEKRVTMSFVRELFEVRIELIRQLVSELLDVEKNPCRPHYALAVATPLCLYECRFSNKVSGTVTVEELLFSHHFLRARLIENMVDALTDTPFGTGIDLNKGLHEFTQNSFQDRPLPVRYVKFADRKTCDSLEQKREKLERKKQAMNSSG